MYSKGYTKVRDYSNSFPSPLRSLLVCGTRKSFQLKVRILTPIGVQICRLFPPSTPKGTNQSARRVWRSLQPGDQLYSGACTFLRPCGPLVLASHPSFSALEGESFFLVSPPQILAPQGLNDEDRKCAPQRRVPRNQHRK